MRTLDVFYQSWTKRRFRKKWTELLSCGMEALSIFYFQGKASKLHFDSLDTHSRRKCGRFPKEGSAPYSQFKGKPWFPSAASRFHSSEDTLLPCCKAICFYRVPISKPDDLCCVVLKINLNLAPFAVAVCLVFVDCGGDFSFCAWPWISVSAGQHGAHLRQPEIRQLVHRFPIGSFCTAGSAALKHDCQFFKGGAAFHEQHAHRSCRSPAVFRARSCSR